LREIHFIFICMNYYFVVRNFSGLLIQSQLLLIILLTFTFQWKNYLFLIFLLYGEFLNTIQPVSCRIRERLSNGQLKVARVTS
jgi:hypothetical protein